NAVDGARSAASKCCRLAESTRAIEVRQATTVSRTRFPARRCRRSHLAVGLFLIVSGDLEREGLVMFESGTPVETDTRDAGDLEFDNQNVTRFAVRVVVGRMVDRAHRAVGKGFGV